jgi:proteasome lid subunit RPN8/RPN11
MIRLDDDLLRLMHGHAADAYPHECCGALLGGLEEEGRRVRRLLRLDNQREGEAARRRFLVTGEEYRRTEKRARELALDLLGFYHSHPDHPARPSEYDREHALPWFSYVIVSVTAGRAGETTSWTLAEDRSRFDAEVLEVTRPEPGASTDSSQ